MSSAANLYHSVISDVITSIRDSFLDESVDENVLVELKQLWDEIFSILQLEFANFQRLRCIVNKLCKESRQKPWRIL